MDSRLGRGLVVGGGLAIALLGLNIGLTYENTRRLRDAYSDLAHTNSITAGLERVLSLAKDAEAGQRGYLITGEVRYLEPYHAAVATLGDELDRLELLVASDPKQKSGLSGVKQHLSTQLGHLAEAVALRTDKGFDAAREIMLTDRDKAEMDGLRESVSAMLQEERRKLRLQSEGTERSYRTALLSEILSGFSALAALGAFMLLLQRHLATRSHAARVIEDQRELLRTTLASIGDAVITTDTLGRIDYLNGVAASLTGWTQAEAERRPLESVFNIVDEGTREPIESPATRALRDGTVTGLTAQALLLTKEGKSIPIDDSAAPIRGEGGRALGCVLVFRDVSERRRNEATMQQSQERLTQAQLAGRFGAFEWNVDDNRTIWAPELEALYGLRAGEFEGGYEAWTRRVHAEDRPRVERELAAAVAEGGRFSSDFRVVWPDGSVHWLGSRGELVANGATRPRRFVGVNFDITDRKEAEESRRLAEERFQQLANTIPQLAWTAEPDGRISWFNERWYTYTGMPPDETRDWAAAHDAERYPKIRESWAASVDSGTPFEMEFPLRGADGLFRWFLIQAAPLRSARGEILQWFATGTDITALRELEGTLREADRRKDEFLATLAHELRNPLAPLRNALSILRVEQGSPQAFARTHELMERQMAHIARLIDDLLDASRLSRGKLELRLEPLEVASVVYQAVEACRPQAESASQIVTVTLPPRPIHVSADPVRLGQVFSNLLNNACKFTEPGGHIELSVERQGLDLLVSVKDTGIGIADEMLPHVFDMFTQVDRSLERSQGGLGIGLTLVRRLVEMQGGTVTAHSEGLGKGSEFKVRMPIVIERPSTRENKGNVRSERLPVVRRRILVVDDNFDAADSLTRLLRLRGNEVQEAHDGQAAVETAVDYRPEVVLLDLGLPKLSGYDVARKIRQLPWGKDVLLVAITGWGQDEDRRRSHEAGFDFHLVKPVDPSALLELLAGP